MSGLGQSASRTIDIDVFALFALNSGLGPTMADGKSLIHADHNNVGTSGVQSITTWEDARVTMATQLDPNQQDYLDLRPSLWLGPVALSGVARQINESTTDTSGDNPETINYVRGMVQSIVDTPRLSGAPYYFLAPPSQAPVFEVVFLDGQQDPFLDMQEGFNVDGVVWKVRLDYGVGATDYRGIVRNAGT
jgi:hypothetical protein